MKRLPIIAWLACVLFLYHAVLFVVPAGMYRAVLSDLLQLATSLLATVAAYLAARRSSEPARYFWLLVALATGLWSCGECFQIYYSYLVHSETSTPLFAALLFFLSFTPMFVAAFAHLRDDDGPVSWGRMLDVLQLLLALLACYLMFVVVPTFLRGEAAMQHEWLTAINVRNFILVAAYGVRVAADRSRTGRRLMLPIFIALLVYSLGSYFGNQVEVVQGLGDAAWLDLAWTFPFLTIAISAAYWTGEQNLEESPISKRGPMGVLWFYIPSTMMPLVLLQMHNLVVWEQIYIGMVTLFISVVLFGLRVGLLYQRQAATTAELRHSEDRYRSLFEQNMAGVFRSTIAGKILDINPAFARMFGYERDELINLPAAVLYEGGEQERKARLQEKRSTEPGQIFEQRYRRKDGTLLWAIQNVTFRHDEQLGGDVMEGTIIDITERRNLELQLRQAQKMEAVGRLAGGIAHDFNNLLTVISGYSQMQLDETDPGSQIHEHAEQVYQASKRAAALTRQLLAFSRQQVLQPQLVNLNNIISNMEKMLRRIIRENINIEIVQSPELDLARLDIAQVEQVILNLTINARDAMPRGGTLRLETRNIELTEKTDGEYAEVAPGRYAQLAVSDTGVGMDATVLARIFEPFFTTKETGKGTGLGLSTVYGIVRQSGGHVLVHSQVGVGSTFTLLFPIAQRPARSESADVRQEQILRGKETILVVEDDDALREMTRAVLSSHGYRVLVASTAEEVPLRCAECSNNLDLLLSDVVMPGLSGPGIAESLRQKIPTLRLLLMSGYSSELAFRKDALPPGAHFLQKPFSPRLLAEKVREVLDKPLAMGSSN
ncbi:MAG TPA: PAS domain S-box protein [candidate division Zixibacteria bacterium]|nr:PAS domain S-box protein [candidate division Zixibacteria bacterium]